MDDDPTGLFGIGLEIGAPVRSGQILPLRGHQDRVAVDLSAAIREELGAAELDIPVAVENDVNALAVLAMHRAHYADPDFVVVSVFDEGVGGGLVLDGRLRGGANGQAMEIGHLSVGLPPGAQHALASGTSPEGTVGAAEPMAVCACGEPGHVDALATPAHIRELLQVDSIAHAAQEPAESNSRAAGAFADAGAALGRAIAHVSNTVNPSRLVLFLPRVLAEAPEGTAGACYLEAVRREIGAAFAAVDDETYLAVEALPADEAGIAELGATAAAACVLESFIEHALRLDGCPASSRRSGRPASAA